MDKDRVVASARAALGTPFHHQGRLIGRGLDCIGVVVCAFSAAGLNIQDSLDYARQPDGKKLETALREHRFEKQAMVEAGDVLLFRIVRHPQHVGIAISPHSMIHAYAPQGRVIETMLAPQWLKRLHGIYRYCGN